MSIVIDDKKITNINISNKNVQKIVDTITNKIIFEKTKPSTSQYFYIEDLSGADNTIILRKTDSMAPTVTLEYSKDKTNWSVWGQTTNDDNLTLSLQANSKIYFRGTNNVFGNSSGHNYFRCTGKFGVGGDVTTLLEPSGNVLDLSGRDYVFYGLFFVLWGSQKYLVSASDLLLPSTTLSKGCYNRMFMYDDLLSTSPVLPASILTKYCYEMMYFGCGSLSVITTYADDISATDCLANWVEDVAPTGTFYNYGSAKYRVDDVYGIPSGWTEVKN